MKVASFDETNWGYDSGKDLSRKKDTSTILIAFSCHFDRRWSLWINSTKTQMVRNWDSLDLGLSDYGPDRFFFDWTDIEWSISSLFVFWFISIGGLKRLFPRRVVISSFNPLLVTAAITQVVLKDSCIIKLDLKFYCSSVSHYSYFSLFEFESWLIEVASFPLPLKIIDQSIAR